MVAGFHGDDTGEGLSCTTQMSGKVSGAGVMVTHTPFPHVRQWTGPAACSVMTCPLTHSLQVTPPIQGITFPAVKQGWPERLRWPRVRGLDAGSGSVLCHCLAETGLPGVSRALQETPAWCWMGSPSRTLSLALH